MFIHFWITVFWCNTNIYIYIYYLPYYTLWIYTIRVMYQYQLSHAKYNTEEQEHWQLSHVALRTWRSAGALQPNKTSDSWAAAAGKASLLRQMKPLHCMRRCPCQVEQVSKYMASKMRSHTLESWYVHKCGTPKPLIFPETISILPWLGDVGGIYDSPVSLKFATTWDQQMSAHASSYIATSKKA